MREWTNQQREEQRKKMAERMKKKLEQKQADIEEKQDIISQCNKNKMGRIFTIREALVMTQTEFGKAIGTTTQTVSNWENGRSIPNPTFQLIINCLAEENNLSLINWDEYKEKKRRIHSQIVDEVVEGVARNMR